MRNVDDLIEDFNNGNFNFLKVFGNDLSERITTFFKFLERRNKLTEIDPTGNQAGEYQNELLLHFYENDENKFYYWCNELLSDVEFADGKAYIVADSEDLSSLFCDSRDYSRDTVENILSGEMDFNWYDSYDIDIYDNVIHELSLENLNKLKQIFLRDLNGIEISTDEGEMTLTPENIDSVFNDSELVKEILNNELPELESELRSLYFNAERSALEDDYYEEVWNELDEFFYTKEKQWVSVRRGFVWDKEGNKKEKYVDKIRMPILNFETFILDFLNSNKNYGSSGTIEYQGTYIGILAENSDCLRPRFPDYADSSKVENNINDMFGDYIS